MSAYGRFLWKEWRDHRAVVLGIAIAVPLLLLLAYFLLPTRFQSDPILSLIGAWGTLALVTLSLASDLVPGEARRGRIAFLSRLPAGLGAAFAAKMTFLLLALAMAPVYGFLCGALLGGWHTDRWDVIVGPGLLVLCLAPWMFAVSCWLPRGALTLPATALVLALFGLPIYLLISWNRGYIPLVDDVVGIAVCLGAGAFVVAWTSFTRGFRHGGGALAAGGRGLAVTLVLFLPVYAYGGYRIHEWKTIDPNVPNFSISQAQVGEGDRFLFLNTTMYFRKGRTEAHHGLIVDLRDGSWRREGVGFDRLEWVSASDFSAVRVVPALRPGSLAKDERNPAYVKHWMDYYDARTGELFKSAWSNTRPEEVLARATGDRPDWQAGYLRHLPRGRGYLVHSSAPRVPRLELAVVDLIRGRVYEQLPRTRSQLGLPWVSRRGWWIQRGAKYVFRDPETGAEEEWNLEGKIAGVWGDGRLVLNRSLASEVRSGGKSEFVGGSHGCVLFDPETKTNEPIAGGNARYIIDCLGGNCIRAWTERGEAILQYDPESREWTTLLEGAKPFGFDTERILAIEDGQRIIRIDRRTGERTVLFPR